MNVHTHTKSPKTERKFIWSDENLAQAAHLWAQGKTCADIARVFGTSHKSISVMMVKKRELFPKREPTGLPVSKSGQWTEEKAQECVRLVMAGAFQEEVAEKLGISRSAVAYLIQKRPDLFQKAEPKPAEIIVHPRSKDRKTWFVDRFIHHVKRTTQSGAVVTMPRVSFIDGEGSITKPKGPEHG